MPSSRALRTTILGSTGRTGTYGPGSLLQFFQLRTPENKLLYAFFAQDSSGEWVEQDHGIYNRLRKICRLLDSIKLHKIISYKSSKNFVSSFEFRLVTTPVHHIAIKTGPYHLVRLGTNYSLDLVYKINPITLYIR